MITMVEMELNIINMYPDILNMYGDIGNLICIKQRAMWRGIKVNIQEITLSNETTKIDENTDKKYEIEVKINEKKSRNNRILWREIYAAS